MNAVTIIIPSVSDLHSLPVSADPDPIPDLDPIPDPDPNPGFIISRRPKCQHAYSGTYQSLTEFGRRSTVLQRLTIPSRNCLVTCIPVQYKGTNQIPVNLKRLQTTVADPNLYQNPNTNYARSESESI
jgi:hypothetical protein